jgi:hypothetical protein
MLEVRWFATLAVTVFVMMSIGATAAPAKASTPTSPSQAGVVVKHAGPGHAPGEPAASVAGNVRSYRQFLGLRELASTTKACKQHPWYQSYDFKNVYGVVLFSYYEQVYYCRNGVSVTYFYRYRWARTTSIVPVVHYTPWNFEGHVPSGNDCPNEHCFIRGYKAKQRTAVTEGKFATCLIPFINVGCNYVYPVIHITVYGDGSRPDSGWSD